MPFAAGTADGTDTCEGSRRDDRGGVVELGFRFRLSVATADDHLVWHLVSDRRIVFVLGAF
jgi:hypothetical protein